MTNKKNNKTMKEKTTLSACIPAGKPVLDYLKEKSGERHTKLEAYCDLLDKISAGYVSDALKKLDVELQPGQSAVTITDLAGCWHWHRATVRSFLKGLEDLGQIRKSSLTRSYIITMAAPDSVGDGTGNGKGNAGDVLVDRLDALLYEWVSGRLSDVECGKACQRLANAGTAVFADQNQDSIPDKGKAAHAEICMAIMERMAFASVRRVLQKYRSGSAGALADFFNEELAEDWTLVPEAMETLAELVIDGVSESLELEDKQAKETFHALCKPFKTLIAIHMETGNGNR